jgi:hypothetical protein
MMTHHLNQFEREGYLFYDIFRIVLNPLRKWTPEISATMCERSWTSRNSALPYRKAQLLLSFLSLIIPEFSAGGLFVHHRIAETNSGQ